MPERGEEPGRRIVTDVCGALMPGVVLRVMRVMIDFLFQVVYNLNAYKRYYLKTES